MILNDRQIKELCGGDDPMIRPFQAGQMGSPSFGCSSFGYDVRVGNRFRLFNPLAATRGAVIDPRAFDDKACVEIDAFEDSKGSVILPPHSFALAETMETFNVPRDVLVLCVGKSTYARCGLIVNVTPLEPEWRGTVTLEISNTTPLPARVVAGMGIAQLLFLRGEPCERSYADKKGKYQDQKGIQGPRA